MGNADKADRRRYASHGERDGQAWRRQLGHIGGGRRETRLEGGRGGVLIECGLLRRNDLALAIHAGLVERRHIINCGEVVRDQDIVALAILNLGMGRQFGKRGIPWRPSTGWLWYIGTQAVTARRSRSSTTWSGPGVVSSVQSIRIV